MSLQMDPEEFNYPENFYEEEIDNCYKGMGGREEIFFEPLEIEGSPVIEDVVGTSRKFIEDFVLSKNNEKVYESMGIQPDKTFLLAGKPGTGKTMAIKALNNSLNREIFEVISKLRKGNYNSIDTSKIGEEKLLVLPYDIGKYGTAYINEGSRRVESFFEFAYDCAERGSVLISVDEADVLFGSRKNNSSEHKEDNKVLETFMKNLQISHDTPGIHVVLMSNLPELCDEASLRAGRIDKRYKFELPNLEERMNAYEKMINKKNKNAGYMVVRGYDLEKLGEISEGFSYADINQTIEQTIRKRAKEISIERKRKVIPQGYVTQNRLEKTLEQHKKDFDLNKKSIGF